MRGICELGGTEPGLPPALELPPDFAAVRGCGSAAGFLADAPLGGAVPRSQGRGLVADDHGATAAIRGGEPGVAVGEGLNQCAGRVEQGDGLAAVLEGICGAIGTRDPQAGAVAGLKRRHTADYDDAPAAGQCGVRGKDEINACGEGASADVERSKSRVSQFDEFKVILVGADCQFRPGGRWCRARDIMG